MITGTGTTVERIATTVIYRTTIIAQGCTCVWLTSARVVRTYLVGGAAATVERIAATVIHRAAVFAQGCTGLRHASALMRITRFAIWASATIEGISATIVCRTATVHELVTRPGPAHTFALLTRRARLTSMATFTTVAIIRSSIDTFALTCHHRRRIITLGDTRAIEADWCFTGTDVFTSAAMIFGIAGNAGFVAA